MPVDIRSAECSAGKILGKEDLNNARKNSRKSRTVKRIKLIVAYDGTNYCGWQKQINGIAVEEVLNRKLSELLGENIEVIGASRTDSGVHAFGNVAVFDTQTKIPAEKISFALNQRLPEDITIQGSEEVPPDFHPRFCNSKKTYEYKILNRRFDMPIWNRYTHFVYMPLDIEKMKSGAQYLVGKHDFKSFCSARTQVTDTVRTIHTLEIGKDNATGIITFSISGDGFLYNMVRIIIGTLIKVGLSVYPPEHVKEILEARDRNVAGPKAPAKGLSLIGIEYEPEVPLSDADGIIFDIDGTLWDIRETVCEAWSAAVQENTDLPVEFDAEGLGKLFGRPMDEIFFTLYPQADEEMWDQLRPLFYEYEHRYIRQQKPRLYEGAEETLEKLSKHYPLYIVTNAQCGYVEELFAATGIGKYFQGWLCYGDTLASKDVTLQRLAQQYHLKQPVYIGDTKGDAEACRLAKIPFIYAAYGLGEVRKPRHLVRDVRELLDYFS